ncbi:MAG TPA: M64 family metallopeptidase, partial [Saprospiraceae bacterium]|nr:M64 family metallopeptidase [Saprospiraceae bacterium]
MKNILVKIAWILAACTLPSMHAFSQATIQQLLSNGPTDKRINIVFLSEGYTSAEMSKYINTDVLIMLNQFTGTFPFAEYATYFNAFAISVESAESGSDHPSLGIDRNTFFSSTYETAGITRLLTLQGIGYWRVDSLLQLLMPEYDIVVVIVNDTQYGGSGGSIAVTSINSAAPEIVMHELGHSFGWLADEYEDATPGYVGSETPNTTAETDRNFIKWRTWIANTTPIPTPETAEYSGVVGLFEGASYERIGWFRPKLNCKMRTLGIMYCEVCSEDLVESAYRFLRPIESFSPAQPAL